MFPDFGEETFTNFQTIVVGVAPQKGHFESVMTGAENGGSKCGAACKCGSGCSGCKMFPDFGEETFANVQTIVVGVAPQKGHFESLMTGAENGGCKCGDICTCNPCNCK